MTSQPIADTAWDLFLMFVRNFEDMDGEPNTNQLLALRKIADGINTDRRVHFSDFIQTATFSGNLGQALRDASLEGCVGYVYADALYIEWHPELKSWYLLLGRSEYTSSSIEDLEMRLWLWAIREGYTFEPTTPQPATN